MPSRPRYRVPPGMTLFLRGVGTSIVTEGDAEVPELLAEVATTLPLSCVALNATIIRRLAWALSQLATSLVPCLRAPPTTFMP